jgi:hypothetical protein
VILFLKINKLKKGEIRWRYTRLDDAVGGISH